jgi:hypothetical protein
MHSTAAQFDMTGKLIDLPTSDKIQAALMFFF